MTATTEAKPTKKKVAEKKKPTPRKPKKVSIYDTELEPLQEADEILKKIEKQQVKVKEARFEWDDSREETKLLKGTYEAAQLKLEDLCRIRKEKHPLFDKQKPADDKATDKPEDAKKDDWKALPITEFGLPAGTVKLLSDAGCETLGKLSDRMAKHGDFWTKDIKGLGEEGAAKVSDGFVAFWSRHPEYCDAK